MRTKTEIYDAKTKALLLQAVGPEHSDLTLLGARAGTEALDILMDILGGLKVHIPSPVKFWSGLAREIRNGKMRAEFNGSNYAQLAAAYSNFMGLPHLSSRHVRHIVHKPARRTKQKTERYRPIKIENELHARIASMAQRYGATLHHALGVIVMDALANDERVHHDLAESLNKEARPTLNNRNQNTLALPRGGEPRQGYG